MESTMNLSDLSIVAEVELIYRNKVRPSERPRVSKSRDAYDCFMATWNLDKIEFVEQFKVMLLNRAGRVLGIVEVSTGGVSGTFVDVKVIFSAALKGNASSIILAHNHPSGNLKPSQADLELTKKISRAGEILDIRVNEHLIITSEGFYSFADEGLI
jgi:DNA repair protein RadC